MYNTKKSSVYGGGSITYNKNDIVLDAKKRKVSIKTNNGGIEISGILTVIDNDTTYFQNELVPHESRHGDRKELIQYFYYYRDTVYGDWYRVIHEGQKIHVKLNENNTGKSRKLMIEISDGDRFGSVNVTQKSQKE